MKVKSIPASILLPGWVLYSPDYANAGSLDHPPPPPPPPHDHENPPPPPPPSGGDCPPPPPPGPPKPKNDGTYNEGVTRGVHEASRIWHDGGCDCANIWGFEEEVDDLMEANFDESPNDTDKQDAYKRGVRDGASLVVTEHERECLDETPDECFDLGSAAAMQIAFDYCPFSAQADSYGYGSDEPDYKQSCREVAYGVCEGAILKMVESNGCDPPTSDVAVLQEECEGQVDSMTPDADNAVKEEMAVERRGLRKK
ncbi:hypothetical protein ACHAXN_006239 [Cyclotella atomus]